MKEKFEHDQISRLTNAESKGKQIGMTEALTKVAKNMLESGMDIPTIGEITEFTEDKLKNL